MHLHSLVAQENCLYHFTKYYRSTTQPVHLAIWMFTGDKLGNHFFKFTLSPICLTNLVVPLGLENISPTGQCLHLNIVYDHKLYK